MTTQPKFPSSPKDPAPKKLSVTDRVRIEVAAITAGIDNAPLLIVLVLLTAALSVAGAAVGHPLFHLKLVSAAAVGRMMWPAFSAADAT